MDLRLLTLIVVLCPLWAGLARAQSSPSRHADSPPDDSTAQRAPQSSRFLGPRPSPTSMSVWMGGSMTTGDLIGNISRGQLGLIGIRYNRRVNRPENRRPPKTSLTYTADFLPAVFLSIPATAIPPPSEENGSENERAESASRTRGMRAYGVGISPAGFRVNLEASRHVVPFFAGSTGLVYFDRAIPDRRGKQVNFTLEFGAGIQVIPASGVTLTLGYRYHHLSNGYRGDINPGVDANLLYLGVSVW